MQVSLLGLGLVKIGRNTGLKYPTAFNLPSDEQVLELLREAHGAGITLLDTAPAYGTSELRLGKALQALPELARDCVISSKVGESFDNGTSTFDFSESAIKRSIDRSLERLRRNQLDIVLLHSSGDDEQVLTEHSPLATLQHLQYQGLIGACGFSGKTLNGGRLALELGAEVLMITLNAEQQGDLPLVEEAAQCGAGVLVKKPLGSGYDSTDTLKNTASLAGVSSMVVGTLSPAHLRANAILLGDR